MIRAMKKIISATTQKLRRIPAFIYQHKLKIGTAVAASVALQLWLAPPAIIDLSEEAPSHSAELLESWDEGEVIVVMRHLERCDRYDVPCLTSKEGITARSEPVAKTLRAHFHALGLEHADIYNSPMLRTAETEALVFDDIGHDQDWLIQCQQDFLGDSLKNKKADRNLVLITHSRCIKRFQKALELDDETPKYGAALFFHVGDEPGEIKALGFIDADDWETTLDPLRFRPRSEHLLPHRPA